MVPNDEALMRSMYGVIVRMLAHVYVPESATYDETVDTVDTVDYVQDIIELNETASLVNANSYAFYAGCESQAWFLLFPPSFSLRYLHPTSVSYGLLAWFLTLRFSSSSRLHELAYGVSV